LFVLRAGLSIARFGRLHTIGRAPVRRRNSTRVPPRRGLAARRLTRTPIGSSASLRTGLLKSTRRARAWVSSLVADAGHVRPAGHSQLARGVQILAGALCGSHVRAVIVGITDRRSTSGGCARFVPHRKWRFCRRPGCVRLRWQMPVHFGLRLGSAYDILNYRGPRTNRGFSREKTPSASEAMAPA
jgi:hypothetical protein